MTQETSEAGGSLPDELQRDPDTGMVSREDFDRLLDYELERARRTNRWFTLAILDLDNFGKTVAQVGERQGALLLKKVAQAMRAHSREGDVLGKGVGDQFLVLMPMSRPEQAMFVIEDLRRLLASSTFKLEGDVSARVTISAGISSLPKDGSTREELTWKAEAALWDAKMAGRNVVALAREEKMVLKSNYYPKLQLQQLQYVATALQRSEASILREALADFLRRHEREVKALANGAE